MANNIRYTANLLKGGAVVEDIKILLKHWRDDMPQQKLVLEFVANNVLSKKSRNRTDDVISRLFIPRYINSYPEKHWIYLKQFIETDIAVEFLRPLLYFYCALNEPLINDFVVKVLLERYESGILDISSMDAVNFIKKELADNSIPVNWGDGVIKRVASAMITALKEFGIIEGSRHRKISPKFIPLPVFYYIAFFIYKEGSVGKKLINHKYWKLFLLNDTDIEHLFMEAHQEKYIRYEKIGDISRIEFFETTFEEAVNVIIKRTA